MNQFDEQDEEIAEEFMTLGMGKNVAMTLAFLHHTNPATSVDIERGANLHQPEVSIATKQLKDRDWISEREEKMPGKGRPYKIFSLKVGFDEIIAQLEEQQKKTVDEAKVKIERLKELGKK